MRNLFGIFVLALVLLGSAGNAWAQGEEVPLSSLEAHAAEITQEDAQSKADALRSDRGLAGRGRHPQ